MESVRKTNFDQQKTVRNGAAVCRRLFLDILSLYIEDDALVHITKPHIQDEFGRFNLWTANNGVFAPYMTSLDARLVDNPTFKEELLAQLEALRLRLNETRAWFRRVGKEIRNTLGDTKKLATPGSISSQALPSSYITDLVHHVHTTIDWLRRFSNLITKERFPGYDHGPDNQLQDTDSSGNDMTAFFSSDFEHIVRQKCPNLPESLVERCVKTMIIRRKNIMHRRSTRSSWAPGLDQSQIAFPDIPAGVLMDPKSGRAAFPSVEGDYTSAISARHASHVESSLEREDHKDHAAAFPTSRARTDASSSNVRLRSSAQPQLPFPGQIYICSYCHVKFSSKKDLDNIGWTYHFEIDLAPYICLFDECSQPYQMFTSKNDWLSHMGTQHCLKWRCVATGHEPILFNDEELFICHMLSSHPGSFREDKLRFIANSSTHISMPIIKHCPFCLESGAAEDLEGHVIRHLHHFALESVPGGLIAVRQSRSGSTDKGGIQGYDEHQVDSTVSHATTLRNRSTAERVDTASPGRADYRRFYNPSKTEQADKAAHDGPIQSPPMTP